MTWVNCTLRNWLNNEFIKEFSNLERERIIETDVDGVNDRIFLLKRNECSYYDAYCKNSNMFKALSRTINVENNKMIDLYPNNDKTGISETESIFPALWLKF